MKRLFSFSVIVSLSLLFVSCNKTNTPKDNVIAKTDSIEVPKDHILTSSVLTAEEQAALSPEDVINILQEGNQEFIDDNLTIRNNTQRVRDAALAQYPKAVILSCIDSRVPVEDVFHRGIGDIFVARVGGNIVNPDILGSIEYACKVSGSKAVVVLGHEYCGAIKSAIDDAKLGNITTLLAKIRPAVLEAGKDFAGDKTSKNPDFVEEVCHKNIELTVKEIREKSPVLKEMEDKGEIVIVGAVYEMKTGKVTFLGEL